MNGNNLQLIMKLLNKYINYLKRRDKNYYLTTIQSLGGLQAKKYQIQTKMYHPLMIMKLRSTMNNMQKTSMMKTHKKYQKTFKKKTYIPLPQAAIETKKIMTLMITRKAQVNKILKYTKRKMTKKLKIIKTLKKIYLMKYDTLLIVTTRR